MSDETVKDDAPDLGPDASKADLKAAADEILKAAKAAAPEAEPEADFAAEDTDIEEPIELTHDQQLLALEVEKQELRDQMLRAMAEMENLRKRSERERAMRVSTRSKSLRVICSASQTIWPAPSKRCLKLNARH
ncbi:MAG: hypothetical protein Hens2KO_18820 [Henriciella sp.]